MNPNRCSRFRRSLSGVLAAVLLLAGLLPAQAARAQGAPTAADMVEECGQVDESKLHGELRRITKSVFDEERDGLNVADIVKEHWDALDLDATVDAAVDAATARVEAQTPWWERPISWLPWKMLELTKRIAAYAFGSPEFKEKFNQLSDAIADDVAAEIRLIAVKSASSSLDCVLTYLDGAVSPTMATILEKQIQGRFDEHSVQPEGEVDWRRDFVKTHPSLLGGVGVLSGTRLAGTLGNALADKSAIILGNELIKALIKWLVEILIPIILNGSFPLIRAALKSQKIKRAIRAEITRRLEDNLSANLPQIAGDIADEVFSQWQEFRREHARVLELAQTSPRFQALLNETSTDKVPALSDLVALFEERLGEERLLEEIESGQLEIILRLPTESLELLRATEDPALVIAWADLAGIQFSKVVDLEVYRVASPSDFTARLDLKAILALDDPDLIQQLMPLEADARRIVLNLAQTSPRFQALLNETPVDMAPTLGELVALFEERLGEERLLEALELGQFERILHIFASVKAYLQALSKLCAASAAGGCLGGDRGFGFGGAATVGI